MSYRNHRHLCVVQPIFLFSIIFFSLTFFATEIYCGVPPQTIINLINKIRIDAEKQIISVHGRAGFDKIKKKILQEYKPDSLQQLNGGNVCPALGFFDESDESIGSLFRAKPLSKSGSYYLIGSDSILSGHPKIAKWCFSSAASIAPGCPVYLSNLAFILNEEKGYENAKILLEHAITLDPLDSSILINLAFSYQYLKQYNNAIGALTLAVSLNPGIKKYQVMLSELKDLKENEDKAKVVLPPIRTNKEDTPSEAHQLDSALDILDEHGQESIEKEISSITKPKPDYRGRDVRRKAKESRVNPKMKKDPKMDEAIKGAAALSAWFVNSSIKAATELERSVDLAASSIGTYTGGSLFNKAMFQLKKAREFQKTGQGTQYLQCGTNFLYYTVAAMIRTGLEDMGVQNQSVQWKRGELEKTFAEMMNERKKWVDEFFKNIDKENFCPPVCVGKICTSYGDDGSTKIEISEDWLTTEVTMHPTNIYKYGFKISAGPKLKQGLGEAMSVEASTEIYGEWKFGRGYSEGVGCNIGASVGKTITTKSGKSVCEAKITYENYP